MTVPERSGAIKDEAAKVGTVAERVGELLRIADMTPAEADRLIPRPRSSTSLLVSKKPDPQCVQAICYALLFGVSLDWLLAGVGEQPDPESVREHVEQARKEHAERAQNGKADEGESAAA
jgi:hypothetical protein